MKTGWWSVTLYLEKLPNVGLPWLTNGTSYPQNHFLVQNKPCTYFFQPTVVFVWYSLCLCNIKPSSHVKAMWSAYPVRVYVCFMSVTMLTCLFSLGNSIKTMFILRQILFFAFTFTWSWNKWHFLYVHVYKTTSVKPFIICQQTGWSY